MAWIATPASPPTTVPLIRMNCRSRPTCSSMRSAVSFPSHRLTVAEMIVAKKWLDNEVYSVAERTDGR